MMTSEERRLLIAEIADVLASSSPPLTEEEQQWVRMAIQREAQSIALRKAIIEKTLGSLVWSAIVGIGYLSIDYLKTHGLRI